MANELLELIQAGKLKVGTILYHPTRQHPERGREAVVTVDGLRLGSRIYSSPSAAAKVANDGYEANGWTFWRVKTTRKPLKSLRRKN
jgi:hypothetical protein